MKRIFENSNDLVMHMASLVELAHTDGKFLECEQVCLSQLAVGYASQLGNIDFNSIFREVENREPSKEIFREKLKGWQENLRHRPIAARVLLKDMVLLGYSDDEYGVEERRMVLDAATRFGISVDVLKAIEDVVFVSIEATSRMRDILMNGLTQGVEVQNA